MDAGFDDVVPSGPKSSLAVYTSPAGVVQTGSSLHSDLQCAVKHLAVLGLDGAYGKRHAGAVAAPSKVSP